MSSKYFHTLRIQKVYKSTKDCSVITFDIPSHLKNEFTFKAGQYLTLKAVLHGEEIRRSYSLCTSPSENSLSIAVKKIPNGVFSTYANDVLKTGETVEVMVPSGNFIIEDPSAHNFVFFAAGSGITPIISHIRYVLQNDKDANITLFYVNKNHKSIIFREELEGIKNKYIDRIAIHHIFTREKTSSPLLSGRIDANKCTELSKSFFNISTTDAFLICGPNDMIFDIKDALIALGVAADQIHFELFNTLGLQKTSNIAERVTDTSHQIESDITIQMDGDIIQFSLDYSGQNLLDAAIAKGADLPFSCKGGVCSTCKAKVIEGEVIMDVNFALEPYELEAGYVLMCQSHPRTAKVSIDFDQK